jgi:hypothetical protein
LPGLHGRALERRQTGVLDVARDAEADEPARLARPLLPRAKILEADRFQRGVEARVIVAAVVGDRRAVARHHPGLVGELIGADEAAAAHFGAIEAELARDAVGEAFEHEGDVGPSGAAHRARRHLVGEGDLDRDIERLERIRAGKRREQRRW